MGVSNDTLAMGDRGSILGRGRPSSAARAVVVDLDVWSSLDALEGMPELEAVAIRGRGQVSLKPLARLPKLRELDLEGWQARGDLSGLVGCARLSSLSLPDHRLDLSPLEGLEALRGLSLGEGFEQLARLRLGLESLSVGSVDVAELSFLSGVGPLKTLRITKGARLDDLGALSEVGALEELEVPEASVRDLAPLAILGRLRALDLRGNAGLCRLSGLSGLSLLERLDVDRTGVEDLSALSGCVALSELGLRETRVRGLGELSGCGGLKRLYLERSALSSLEGVGALGALEALWLWGTVVRDLSPLAGMSGLRELNIAGLGRVTGAEALSTLSGLEALDVRGTELGGLKLARLPRRRRAFGDDTEPRSSHLHFRPPGSPG